MEEEEDEEEEEAVEWTAKITVDLYRATARKAGSEKKPFHNPKY